MSVKEKRIRITKRIINSPNISESKRDRYKRKLRFLRGLPDNVVFNKGAKQQFESGYIIKEV